ncbi:pyridoxal-phosphate dependent enzyme [Neorhizobium galegae]|uniref:pyridoxal-phosphate dependent enzyme n=2 Tax=Neorhizobium galegae TaxID=399 RepID=UPI00351D6589
MSERVLMRNLSDFENPRFIRLSTDLWGASFPLMKMLPARYMLERAAKLGLLKPGGTICESSSGTFGLALAMLARQYDYGFTMVSDWALDRNLHKRLLELGVKVEIVKVPAAVGGIQQARLDKLAEILKNTENSYWPSQYSNPDNPLAYAQFAEQLFNRLGNIDCIVGPVGSGGSMCGTSRFLRIANPDLHVIGVDTPNSALFGQPIGIQQHLSGLGGHIVPRNVDHSQFNVVHWLTPAEVFESTHKLHRQHGLYLGPTSGAAYKVANWWSRKNPNKKAVVIFPDEGHRYVETVYDEKWLSSVFESSPPVRQEPVAVLAPTEEMTGWSTYAWDRRTLDDVVSGPSGPTSSCSTEREPTLHHVSNLNLDAPSSRSSGAFIGSEVGLQKLTAFDYQKVSHLDLDPEQERYVDPLELSFSELESNFAPKSHHPFAIIACGEAVGFFILREGAALPEWAPPGVCTLHSLRVGREYQGKGYGIAATRLAIEWLKTNRPCIKRLMLGVNVRNVTARLVYMKAGFQDTGGRYEGPCGPQDILRFDL